MTPYRAPRRGSPAPKSFVTRAPAQTRSLMIVAAALALGCVGLTTEAALGWTRDPFVPGLGALLCAWQAVESPATGRDVDYPDEVPAPDPEDVVAGREGVEIYVEG